MGPGTKTARVIVNPSTDLEFPWSGMPHVLPQGTHIIEDLWPGQEELADVALELFACEDGVKVFETEFEITYKAKDPGLVKAVEQTAQDARQRVANAKAEAKREQAAKDKEAADLEAYFEAKKVAAKKVAAEEAKTDKKSKR